MEHPTIEKRERDRRQPAQLQKYDALRTSFTWAQAEKEMDWLPGVGLPFLFLRISSSSARLGALPPSLAGAHLAPSWESG